MRNDKMEYLEAGLEFICPSCKGEVLIGDNIDENATDGQQSEYIAGYRFCSHCSWEGYIDESMEVNDDG